MKWIFWTDFSARISDLDKKALRHGKLTFSQAMVRGTMAILFPAWRNLSSWVCYNGWCDEVALLLGIKISLLVLVSSISSWNPFQLIITKSILSICSKDVALVPPPPYGPDSYGAGLIYLPNRPTTSVLHRLHKQVSGDPSLLWNHMYAKITERLRERIGRCTYPQVRYSRRRTRNSNAQACRLLVKFSVRHSVAGLLMKLAKLHSPGFRWVNSMGNPLYPSVHLCFLHAGDQELLGKLL